MSVKRVRFVYSTGSIGGYRCSEPGDQDGWYERVLDDDDTPIDAAWLRSVGFESDSFGVLDFHPWGFLGKRLSWADPAKNDAWDGEVVYDGQRMPKPIKTRGDLRLLCRALGIEMSASSKL